MEKCKFCEAELEEESTLCPQCGKDNAELTEEEQTPAETPADEEELTEAEETEAEETEAEETEEEVALEEYSEETAETAPKKSNAGKIALVIAILVVLIAALTAVVLSGTKQEELPRWLQFNNEDLANIPKNGDPTNETAKGTYTASDKKVLKNADVVVAVAGDYTLTLSELQIYYWQEVVGWLNQYGDYAIYFGLDYNKPLDTQMCPLLEGRTWQQYFLASALNSWRTYLAMDLAATEAGFVMDPMYTDYLAQLPATMEQEALMNGFESVGALIEYNVGVGPTVEQYSEFLRRYYNGYGYYSAYSASVTATDEEVEAMFDLHEAEYAANGLTKDTKTVNVRHILIIPATSEDGTMSDEAWATAEAEANALLEQWLAGDMSEASFANLATENTQDPGSMGTGGLYTGVSQGQMVPAFDEWCFDPARQVGDYGIVKTKYGFHIMFYSGETVQWKTLVAEDVVNEKINNMVDAAVEKLPITVYYDKIYLSEAGIYG